VQLDCSFDNLQIMAFNKLLTLPLQYSWTTNKANKLKFFQQMGEWYVHDKCIGKKISEIEKEDEASGALIQPCCSAEPLIKCHYKDKPSKIPCKDFPSIDKNGKSFW
jgi:hypothetical protein